LYIEIQTNFFLLIN